MSDIRVRAIHRGYFGGMIRERFDEFDAPADMVSSWWEPIDGAPAAEAEPEPEPAPVKASRAKKAETVAAPEVSPFADAPEPVRVESEVNAATGGTQPDWLSPVGDI